MRAAWDTGLIDGHITEPSVGIGICEAGGPVVIIVERGAAASIAPANKVVHRERSPLGCLARPLRTCNLSRHHLPAVSRVMLRCEQVVKVVHLIAVLASKVVNGVAAEAAEKAAAVERRHQTVARHGTNRHGYNRARGLRTEWKRHGRRHRDDSTPRLRLQLQCWRRGLSHSRPSPNRPEAAGTLSWSSSGGRPPLLLRRRRLRRLHPLLQQAVGVPLLDVRDELAAIVLAKLDHRLPLVASGAVVLPAWQVGDTALKRVLLDALEHLLHHGAPLDSALWLHTPHRVQFANDSACEIVPPCVRASARARAGGRAMKSSRAGAAERTLGHSSA